MRKGGKGRIEHRHTKLIMKVKKSELESTNGTGEKRSGGVIWSTDGDMQVKAVAGEGVNRGNELVQ